MIKLSTLEASGFADSYKDAAAAIGKAKERVPASYRNWYYATIKNCSDDKRFPQYFWCWLLKNK